MNVLTVNFHEPRAKDLFCHSLRETGFGVIDHHPISPTLIKQTYADWQVFFLSEEKFDYTFQRPKQEGYFPLRSENAKSSKISDLKEFYHFFSSGNHPVHVMENTMLLFNELFSMASLLLQWIEDCLPENIAAMLSEPLHHMIKDSPNTLLRILHYPPIPFEIEEAAVRAAAHEDINLITLLPAATSPGLEVQDTLGHWHSIDCAEGSLVVNVGDMLALCTKDYYRATTHRVINPLNHENYSRYSMPFFLHPRPDVVLANNMEAKTFLFERLHQIGIY